MVAIMLGSVSCSQTDEAAEKRAEQRKAFLLETTQGAWVNGLAVKTFNEETDQVIYNTQQTIFSITNMDYTNNFTLAITGDLTLNNKITVNCSTAGIEGLEGKSYNMTVAQIDEEEMQYWLWDNSSSNGFMVDFSF